MNHAHASVENRVRAALASHESTASLSNARLEPVPGGLSNFSWCCVEGEGRRWFVRLASEGVGQLGADHHNERRVLGLATEAGVAPPVLRCDPDARLLVTQWIEPATLPTAPPSATRVQAIAGRLARLHATETGAPMRVVDFEAQAGTLLALEPVTKTEGRLVAAAAEVFARLDSSRAARVLCHHDLNPYNVIWDASGRPWLVDWEYAGLGDAAIDLASFASQHGLGPQARLKLVRHYAAAGGAVDPDRFVLAGWVFDYVQWLWYRASATREVGVADRSVVETRALRLHASLVARASRVLRCNNAGFGA